MDFNDFVRLKSILDEGKLPYPTHVRPAKDGMFGLPDWTRLTLVWDEMLTPSTVQAMETVLEGWQGWEWASRVGDPATGRIMSVYRKVSK